MITDDLYIVNYCHPNCVPLKNIMRLPKEEAFALAYEMALKNKDTTAFYRFADFENYYPERLKTDELLYSQFIGMGGMPTEKHPLSFVLHGSEYLNEWFGKGIVTKIPLNSIPDSCISFTYGDSMAVLKKQGSFKMLTKDMLIKAMSDYNGSAIDFIRYIGDKYCYMEVQVWCDIGYSGGCAKVLK